MPLVPVLVQMENAGVKINSEELNKYAEVLREQIIQLEKEIFELAGEEFNVGIAKTIGYHSFRKVEN